MKGSLKMALQPDLVSGYLERIRYVSSFDIRGVYNLDDESCAVLGTLSFPWDSLRLNPLTEDTPYARAHVKTYTFADKYTHTHVHTRTHTYTHIHVRVLSPKKNS